MPQHHASADKAYQHLKAALLDGRLARRDRIEIAELARAFVMSVTPVREAAMRLLGEGLLEINSDGGLRAVPLTERRVRELLTVNHRLCLMALGSTDTRQLALIRLGADEVQDIEAATRSLFEGISRSTGNSILIGLVVRVNDGLAPIRRVEPLILPDARSDLVELAARLPEPGRARTRVLERYYRKRLDRTASLTWAARRKLDE